MYKLLSNLSSAAKQNYDKLGQKFVKTDVIGRAEADLSELEGMDVRNLIDV